jgi:hypothetical protein
MSNAKAVQSHIAYELVDEIHPHVVVVELLSREISGPFPASELGEELAALVRPGWPQHFVLDFSNVRSLGSTAFCEIVSFAHKVDHVYICNMKQNLRLSAAMIGLDECVEFAHNRVMALDGLRRAGMRNEEDTVDYPASVMAGPPVARTHRSE